MRLSSASVLLCLFSAVGASADSTTTLASPDSVIQSVPKPQPQSDSLVVLKPIPETNQDSPQSISNRGPSKAVGAVGATWSFISSDTLLTTLVGTFVAFLLANLAVGRADRKKAEEALQANKKKKEEARQALLRGLKSSLERNADLLERIGIGEWHRPMDLTLLNASVALRYDLVESPELSEHVDFLTYNLDTLNRGIDSLARLADARLLSPKDKDKGVDEAVEKRRKIIVSNVPYMKAYLELARFTIRRELSEITQEQYEEGLPERLLKTAKAYADLAGEFADIIR